MVIVKEAVGRISVPKNSSVAKVDLTPLANRGEPFLATGAGGFGGKGRRVEEAGNKGRLGCA